MCYPSTLLIACRLFKICLQILNYIKFLIRFYEKVDSQMSSLIYKEAEMKNTGQKLQIKEIVWRFRGDQFWSLQPSTFSNLFFSYSVQLYSFLRLYKIYSQCPSVLLDDVGILNWVFHFKRNREYRLTGLYNFVQMMRQSPVGLFSYSYGNKYSLLVIFICFSSNIFQETRTATKYVARAEQYIISP